MSQTQLYIVDVFAEEKYAGNQLAVVRNAGTIPDAALQRIAKEMNYSETTFVLSDRQREGGYDVRIFTPAEELPFAGHPTLGTAYVIQSEIIAEPVDNVVLNLKVGPITVTLNYTAERVDVLWMRQKPATVSRDFDPAVMARVLNLEQGELDGRFPVQEVSTGLPFIIVPLTTLEALKKARIDKDRYFELVKGTQAKAVLVFCPQARRPENDLSVRVFADYYGVAEDPATGSANGCLAGYLVKNRYWQKDSIDVRVEQGHEIGRPSLLLLKAQDQAGIINVSVGGKVIPVAKGELL